MSLSFSSAFGSFEIAAQGASLRSLELAGHQLLHDFQDSAAEWAAGSLMFPFPVRMSTGTVIILRVNSTIGPSMILNTMLPCTASQRKENFH